MTIFLPTLAVAFAAFCVWLTVRVVNRRERWAIWSAAIVIALAVYGSAYFALLDPTPRWDKTETVNYAGPMGEANYIIVPAKDAVPLPNYRLIGTAGDVIFAPAHWVDREIRRMKRAAHPTDQPVP
jgi:hypothetical protein